MLCAGLAVMGHTALADEALPAQPSGPAQVSDIQTFLDAHQIPSSEGLADLIQRTLFYTARSYYTPLQMDDLERNAIEGMRKWIEDAPADLAKARKALADAEQTLQDRTAEKTARGEASAIDESDLARLNDAIIEARDARDDAADAVKKEETRLTTDPEKLLCAGLDYAFHELDPHSDCLPHDSPFLVNPDIKPSIGILPATDGESKYILERGLRVKATRDPIDNSPARRAGVLPGDLITSIDGTPLAGMPLRDAIKKLEGEEGSRAVLQIEHGNGPVSISVEREKFFIQSVSWRIINNNIVAISVAAFLNENTADEFAKAIKAGQEALHGAENVAGYVIILRNNGGGRLDQVHKMLDDTIAGENFDRSYDANVPEDVLRRNMLIATQDRKGRGDRMTATPGDLMQGKPRAVLINGYSASASEIMAGAAQAFGAIVVGLPSFGKATVQGVRPLPASAADPAVDVEQNKFKITEQRYVYGPDADSPQWKGVTPDIVIRFMEAAKESESKLPHALLPPENARQDTRTQRFCDKDGTVPPADANLIDPRTGEVDYELACAGLAVLGQDSGMGVRLNPSPTAAPLP